MDIRMVTSYARAMILQWGMSERLGFVNYAGSEDRESIFAEKDYSPETARVIDEEIRRMSDEAYEDARRLLDLNWDKVVAVAEMQDGTLWTAGVDVIVTIAACIEGIE
jgi:cell division protease FtsH